MKVLDLSYHPLDVRSGRWLDLSRKGTHGTPHGGARPYMIAPGVMGYWFDGSSGYVAVPDSASLNPTQYVTVRLWVCPKRLEGGVKQQLVLRHPGTWGTYIDGANIWFFVDTRNAGGSWEGVACTLPSVDRWYRMVGVYDGTSLYLYIGGELKDTGPQSQAIDQAPAGEPLIIGRHPDVTTQHFKGIIAELVIEKDRAWLPDEVREDYYRSPIYRMLRGLPYSVYIKVPWKQTQGGIYVP